MYASEIESETEEATNTSLDDLPKTSTSPSMIEDSCNRDNNPFPSSSYASHLDRDDDSEDNGDITHDHRFREEPFSQHSRRKHSLVLSDDGDENEPDFQNSSFLLSEINAAADDVDVYAGGSANGTADHSQVKPEASSNFCAEMIMLPESVCQGTSDFAEHMDIFMRCQHPLDILNIFHEEENTSGTYGDSISAGAEDGGDVQVNRVSGYHAIPRSCEYCGSHDIDLCKDNSKCDRPKSFFPREIPPFCQVGTSRWKGDGIETMNKKLEEIKLETKEKEEKERGTMACSAWI